MFMSLPNKINGQFGQWKLYQFGHGLCLRPDRRTMGLNGDWSQTIGGKDLDFLLQLNIQTWNPQSSDYRKMAVFDGHSSLHIVAVDHRNAAHLFWLPEQGMSAPELLSLLHQPQPHRITHPQITNFCSEQLTQFWSNAPEPISGNQLKRVGDNIASQYRYSICPINQTRRIHLHILAQDLPTVLKQNRVLLRRIQSSGCRVSAWEWAVMLSDWGGRLALREYQLGYSVAINDFPEPTIKGGVKRQLDGSHNTVDELFH